MGWSIGAYATKDDFNASAYSRQRTPVISAQIRDTDPGFIFFAGDSHIDLYNHPSRVCGRETVNAGLSGVTTDIYAETLNKLDFPHKAGLAVLTIGTNNILRKNITDPKHFLRSIDKIVRVLEKNAEFIVMTAIPPMSDNITPPFKIELIEFYSKISADVCIKSDACSYHDPYQDLRAPGNFGLARPGVLIDGVHAKSYREIYANLPLCSILEAAL